MKISILTPSYNQAAFLEQNIQSILSQGLGDLVEHIVMDGGSIDGSVDILRKYPHLIWKSEKDRGQTHALNKALAISTGDVIGWVNSDDMLPLGALLTVTEFFKRYPNCHALVSNLQIVDENSDVLYKIPAREVTFDGLLNGVECVTQTSTFFRRSVFDVVGNFNESLHYCMDHEFFLRVAKHFRFYTIDADLGVFRRYAESKTGSSAIEFIKDRIAIRRMHGGKVFSHANAMIVYMLISEPLKKIVWLRKLIRRLKGANPDFIRYS
jgi:glycosyltransferase involved in cell wall biosynthesis